MKIINELKQNSRLLASEISRHVLATTKEEINPDDN